MLKNESLSPAEIKEQVQVLLDLSPSFAFFKDKFFRYVMVNKNFADFYGKTTDFFIGKTDKDFVHNTEILDTFLKQDLEVLTKGEKIEFPVVAVPVNDSEIKYVKVTKNITRNYLGYDKLIFCSSVDITPDILEEKKNHEQEIFYKHLFQNNLDGIVLFDAQNYKNIDCNDRVLEIFKCTKDEFINSKVTTNQITFQPDGSRTSEFMQKSIEETRKNGKVRTRFHSLRFDLTPCVLDVNIYKFSDENPDLLVIIFKDITEQHLMMEQLIDEKERFKNLFERNPSGVAIVDFDWNFLSVNHSWEKLLGYSSAELKTKTVPEISHPDAMPQNIDYKNKALKGEIETYKLRKKYYKKDGNLLYGDLTVGVVKDTKGRPSYLMGILTDITDLITTQEELNSKNIHLQKIIDELNTLVYRTSHDLRSPITSVMGLLSLFEINGDDDPNKIYMGMMKTQLGKLDNVIKDIIEYHKISHNEPEKLPVDFESIIQDKFDQLRFLPQFEEIKTNVKVTKEVDYVGDRYLVGILFNNFISNAIKYADLSKDAKFVNIDIHINRKQATIKIEDNGIGIEEEYLDKIFNMFFRATEKSQGTGLGLYMVRETINKMHGSITVSSKHQEGTTFEIVLPNNL